MSSFLVLRPLLLLITVLSTQAQKKPSINIDSKCLGNVLRMRIGPLKGGSLEVGVAISTNGTDVITLTPDLAAKCGYSVHIDPMGNAMVFASLQNCFAQNRNDETFTTVTYLRLPGNHMTEDELYTVDDTCRYTPWASREIICASNYMEVSVRRTTPDNALPEHPIHQKQAVDSWRASSSEAAAGGFHITTVVFFTPEQSAMSLEQLTSRGYVMTNSPTRLVLRSPHHTPETYTQDVAGVMMTVLRTSTIFETKWLVTQIEASAACPTPASVSFSLSTITWYMPRHMDPLVSTDHFQVLEVHMGVDGVRLGTAEVAARGYALSLTDLHVIIEIPIGAVGGHSKSHVQNGRYLSSYSITPMLEMRWIEEDPREDTRYKVLLPISTPLTVRPVDVVDNTVPEERLFRMELGTFLPDVELRNITFSDGALSLAECQARGFNIQEQSIPDGSKTFTLSVPFSDSAVVEKRDPVNEQLVHFALYLIFGFVILPEHTSFAYVAGLETSLTEMVPPSISGTCDHENFYVTVQRGNQGLDFTTLVGGRPLDPQRAQRFGLVQNDTHFSIAVPFAAPDTVFEGVQSSSLRTRLEVVLMHPLTNEIVQDFSIACSFLSVLTECFANGTMTALAVKTEYVPSLNPGQLTLKDPSCGPAYQDDSFAYFLFTASSCGTTRKFQSNVMLYENEISLPGERAGKAGKTATETEEPEYHLLVSCYYVVNTTHTVSFLTGPRGKEPYAEAAQGQLSVSLRLARDASYSEFFSAEEYPVVRFLREPLFFEVELDRAADPVEALALERCWATLHEDRLSSPSWNLVLKGCASPDDPYRVVFHPVSADTRVQNPALFKRFEAQMFFFATDDEEDRSGRVFVHCDVIICDADSPKGGACSGKCENKGTKKGKRHADREAHSSNLHVMSGAILMLSK